MRIAVCDDSFDERKQLCAMLESCFTRRALGIHIDAFDSAEAFLGKFAGGRYQMIFLDIYMPGMTGISLAKTIREADRACALIFTTCSPDHAMESYAFYTAGYLLKPYTERELAEVVDWCMIHPAADLPTVSISCQYERVTLLQKDVLYIETYGRESRFHTDERDFRANKTLSELEETLTDAFLRCHRSYLVNMDRIARIDGSDFIMSDASRIPISSETAPGIKQRYFDYMFRKTWEGR